MTDSSAAGPKKLYKNIKLQNRAGRGTNIMTVSLDDEIVEVEFC